MGLFDTIATQAGSYLGGQLKRVIPSKLQTQLGTGLSAVGQLENGNILGAAATVSSLFAGKLGAASGVATQLAYWNTPTPLFGGITPTDALAIYKEFAGLQLAKKNLFLVEISDLNPESPLWLDGPSYISSDGSRAFNIFVTDVEYSPWTITGDKRRIGAATADSVGGFEAVEMRITTLDDTVGSIKSWFDYKASLVVNSDGTVGVPRDYLVKVRVLHAFITDGSNQNGYEDEYLMRAVGETVSLSRREDNMQEIQMTFTQFDTFL